MPRNKIPFLFLIFFLSIIILFSHSCKRKKSEIFITPDALKNHLQNVRLFGNIYSVETDSFFYSNKDSIFVFISKNIQFYNTNGYLMQIIELDKNMDTVSKKKINYLPNALENYWEEYNFKKHNLTKDTFIYDRNGYKSEERLLLNDSLLYRIEYKTDGIGGILEMKRLLSEYYLINKIYYNEHGLVQRIEEFDPHNKLYKYFTIEYDNFGNEVNRCAFKSTNEIIEYTYTQYNNDGWLQKVIFEDRLYHMREDRTYSQHDYKGNWLKETVLQGKDTVRKRIRMIEYYD